MDAQEARIYIAIIITSIVLAVIIGYFALSTIRHQKRNLALQKANILAEISAMERERSRIAADLHDELGPLMSVIKFQIDYARDSEKVESVELANASGQLDSLIGRMREVANNLMPIALHRKGLIVAIKEYIGNIQVTMKTTIRFTHSGNLDLPEGKSIHVYRTLQEVIHNCMKHAQADKLEVELNEADGRLKMLCRDNGKGFDYDKMSRESRGMGLGSLRNRTEILGGTMLVESIPGKGTAFLFEIPVK
jgi:signal transduction histidine kinase